MPIPIPIWTPAEAGAVVATVAAPAIISAPSATFANCFIDPIPLLDAAHPRPSNASSIGLAEPNMNNEFRFGELDFWPSSRAAARINRPDGLQPVAPHRVIDVIEIDRRVAMRNDAGEHT